MKHVGYELYKVYKSKKVKPEELADKVGMKRRNIYKIFDKPSIDLDLLVKFSEALGYDFMQHYLSPENKQLLRKAKEISRQN